MRTTIALIALCLSTTLIAQKADPVQVSPDLEIIRLSDQAYIHRSYAVFGSFGRVASNGLVYVAGGECLVFDTPPSDELSEQLIGWIAENFPGVKIAGVVVNHFHEDCLGGLKAFHNRGIPSFAGSKTLELARKDGVEVPQHGFSKKKKMKLGGERVLLFYPGAAHTLDNTVAWMPGGKVLFGGCMVKSVGAGKGNVADADEAAWPKTVARVRKKFADAVWVIPGHGEAGGMELLDFTVLLFSRKL